MVAATTLAIASIAAVWALPRPVPEPLALAVALVWGSLFVYVPLRATSWWAWREVVRAAPQPEDRRAFGLVLMLGFGLLIWGLDWGLTESSWAADELRPDWVRDVLRQGFQGGWFDKYPWLHYAVLSIPVSAFELADRLGMLPAGSVASWASQLALMRAVSVMMALGTLVASYLCGVEMVGPRRAVFAPLALLLTPLFLYYGKMANLDVPALCWFAWAMVAFLRIRRGRPARRLRLARHRVGRCGGDERPGLRESRAGWRRRDRDDRPAARWIGVLGRPRPRTCRSARMGGRRGGRAGLDRVPQHGLQPRRVHGAHPPALHAGRSRHRPPDHRRLSRTLGADALAVQVGARLAALPVVGGRHRGRPGAPRTAVVAVAARRAAVVPPLVHVGDALRE